MTREGRAPMEDERRAWKEKVLLALKSSGVFTDNIDFLENRILRLLYPALKFFIVVHHIEQDYFEIDFLCIANNP